MGLATRRSSRGGEQTSAVVDISLLGPLLLTRGGAALDLAGRKRRTLLILLALQPGLPVGRDRIIEALWPEPISGREESTLRVHVSHLRDVLEATRDAPPRVLLTSGSGYLLAQESVRVDVDRFHEAAREGRELLRTNPATALDRLNDALSLARGQPLQDVEYERFAQPVIQRLESSRLDAIEDRAEALIELGEDPAAIEDLEALVHVDPTRERPVLLLMRALYRTGRQSESLGAARQHARQLRDLGLNPSPRLNLLEQRILQHDPDLLAAGVRSVGELKPGRSVRGFELRDHVGAGALGAVYRAFQSSISRQVALKVVHPEVARSPDFVRRFVDEARSIACLEHPHIVPLHDVWRDPAGAVLVMRWMEGGNLATRPVTTWSRDGLIRVFSQLADALAYAHSAGTTHGNLHARNVLFDTLGNAYLSDFELPVTRRAPAGESGSARRDPGVSAENDHPASAIVSDVAALGHLLADVVVNDVAGAERITAHFREVARIATAAKPADRYPDVVAFRSALLDVPGGVAPSAPRRLRRNPFKGLMPFGEADAADFHGRADVVEALLATVGSSGLTALIGASGSGKSSVVRAGLVPALRHGALPGSENWSVATMTPGADPFDAFHAALREVAVTRPERPATGGAGELRASFATALAEPASRALLVVDQFEDVFSSRVDAATRGRFLDGLVDLATDHEHRVRVVLTLRADVSDRALAHPQFGELVSASSHLLPPMRPDQVEEAIRGPARRVGLQVEPGLVAAIVRDVTRAAGSLPLLQYVLAELFERRIEDRLTLDAYRALGGVHGVLERRAEATFLGLPPAARAASRQLFLRMVHLGDDGEETRRRLPLTELTGLGPRAAVDNALTAFVDARLVTRDRDPATRAPTIEVAHETVIRRWTRYRLWIDEARADLLSRRRLAAAARSWRDAGEDPSYLLTGGPLAAAVELAAEQRVALNAVERRYLGVSRAADEVARELDAERRQREAELRHRAGRRLMVGTVAAVVAVLVAAVAVVAWVERQRADDLAAAQERQSQARELAAASLTNLEAGDPELSLLLAIEAADVSGRAGETILPEVVDALHRSLITPRATVEIEGAASAFSPRLLSFSDDGTRLTMVTDDGGVAVISAADGSELGRLPPIEPPAFGIDLHADGDRILTMHRDGIREWEWRTGDVYRELPVPDEVALTTAAYAPDGRHVVTGAADGTIRVWRGDEMVAELAEGGHTGSVAALDVAPDGTRVVSVGPVASDGMLRAWAALVWDLDSGEVLAATRTDTLVLPIVDVAWHPVQEAAVVTTAQGETFLFDTRTGERLNSFGNGQHPDNAVAFDPTGTFTVTAGFDGNARVFGTWVGGEPGLALPAAGVPLRDVALAIPEPDTLVAAVVGVDGRVRISRDLSRSELPAAYLSGIYPYAVATPAGDRYLVSASFRRLLDAEAPTMQVVDARTLEPLVTRPAAPWGGERGAAISVDGNVVAFPGMAGDIEITQVETGATRPIIASAGWTASLDFGPDASLLAGAGIDGTISIWETDTGRLVTRLEGHGDRSPTNRSMPDQPPADRGPSSLQLFAATTYRVDEVRFHPNGEELASAGFDGTVRVWDLETGNNRVLYGFDHEVFSLAYSHDGSLLAASDRVGTVVLLDARSGELVDELEPVSGRTEIVFSPDGRLLAGAGPGPIAHLWDVGTGRIVRRIHGAIYQPRSVAFVADGTQLRVAGGEGFDRGYVLDPDELVAIARDEVARTFTTRECRQYLPTCP